MESWAVRPVVALVGVGGAGGTGVELALRPGEGRCQDSIRGGGGADL